MGEWQTAAEFTKYLNTTFRVEVEGTDGAGDGDGPKAIELKLIAVTPRPSESHEQAGMERFSAVFVGPLDSRLPQQIYRISHPEMGEFEVFLVAIAQDQKGFRYEAVYNYFIPPGD